MENGPFIDGLPINSMVISMAMLVISRWYIPKVKIPQFGRWMVQCENKHRPNKGYVYVEYSPRVGDLRSPPLHGLGDLGFLLPESGWAAALVNRNAVRSSKNEN
jgi:hypothetical protein